jgi:hypothetical protein
MLARVREGTHKHAEAAWRFGPLSLLLKTRNPRRTGAVPALESVGEEEPSHRGRSRGEQHNPTGGER